MPWSLRILLLMPSPDKRKLATERHLERVWEQVQAAEAKARQRRDAALKQAHREGLTIRRIAEITGLSHGRVGQIVAGK
jgi:DNA-directed RNA polymerase specialized sigma24 family protein